MRHVVLIAVLTVCCATSADAWHDCGPYCTERVMVCGPCCQSTAVIHYSHPCPPPCGPYCAPYPYAYGPHHHPYPLSGYNFQFGYSSGHGHGRGHGKHHGGGRGYSFSIGGFGIGR